MRVLVLAKDFPSDGDPSAGIFVLRQVKALEALGHEPLVVRVVPHAPALTAKWRAYRRIPDRDTIEGVPVRTIRAIVPPRMLAMEYLPLQVDSALTRLAAEHRADVVHAHFILPCGLLVARGRLPSVLTAHGSDAYDWAWRRPGLERAARRAVRACDAVAATSEFVAAHVRALADRDVAVAYNGADEGVFAPSDRDAARWLLRIDPDRFVVAFTGRATVAKGVYDLIEATARLQAVRPLLMLSGCDPQDAALSDAIARAGVEARALGTLAQRDVATVLAASDAFCLPSHNEGLPAAVCEAMLAGRPVVATPVGGIPEIVREGESGFLVTPGNIDLLAQRLSDLARHPQRAQAMGQRAYAFARERLTWSVNARRYDELYRRVRDRAA